MNNTISIRKNIIVISIISFILIFSSCSLFISEYKRQVAYNTICWEDNEHIIVYSKVMGYRDIPSAFSSESAVVYAAGEIWRVNVNTGDKELLIRNEGDRYRLSTADFDVVYIAIHDTLRLISEWDSTYLMDENYDNWKTIGGYTCPQISEDGKAIVYLKISNAVASTYVNRLNLDTGVETVLWETTEYIKVIDYDFDRNLLLLNNIRLINLNTGMDTVLIKDYEEISGYTLWGPEMYSRYGRILDEKIIIDSYLNNGEYSKVFIDIDSLDNKSLKYGMRGIPNSDKTRYAFGTYTHIEIFNAHGTLIDTIRFPSNEL